MFYDKFKLLCDQKGVSCNKAATDMGLSNSTPTKWKKTGATPDGTTLAKISTYFGVSVGKLLTNESTGAIEFTVSTKEMQDYLQSKKKAPATDGERHVDPDIYRIERARKNMSEADKTKMMKILEASFEDYFSKDYVDDDLDE